MVLRGQIFTGDALSHVAFTGALAALAFGVDARLGLFALTIAVGLSLGLVGLLDADGRQDGDGRADDVVIGTVFAWVLGLGVLALSIYTSSPGATANGAAGVNVLFGSIFGVSGAGATQVVGALLLLGPLSAPAGAAHRLTGNPYVGLWPWLRAWPSRRWPSA